MAPTPKSLILDLLSTLRRGAMPVRALVAAAELFGIPENNLRVALARLLRAGLVERDERGRYRLGAGAEPVNRRVASWRRTEEALRPWRGAWVAVLGGARRAGAAGRRRERALRLTGFRPLGAGIEVRPDNLAGGVPALRESLSLLGLEGDAWVVRLDELEPERDAAARRAWDALALPESHRRTRGAIEASAARLPHLDDGEAMVESFRVGGRGIRTLVLDPLLPDALVPGDERRALLATMKAYDRLGREAWAGFLAGHGVPHVGTPVDTSLTDRPLAAAAGGVA